MQKIMNASIFLGPEQIGYQKIPVPLPQGNQILIQVKRAGICGTDLTIYSGKHPRARAPLVMGHEIVGIIADIGPNYNGKFKVGDIVTANPLLWCGKCRSCINGNYHVCEKLGLFGIDIDGGFAEYIVVEGDRVHGLSSSISFEEAALCEPIAVGLHAIRESSFKPGDDVTVLGAGIIGALIGFLLMNSGANSVTITDVNEWRLEQTRKLGMKALNANKIPDNMRKSDVVFECSGHPSSYDTISRFAINSGQIVFVGIPSVPVPILLRELIFREINTITVRVYRNEEFAIAASLVSQKKLDFSPFVSTVLPLDHLAQGIEMARTGQGWKVVMDPELHS